VRGAYPTAATDGVGPAQSTEPPGCQPGVSLPHSFEFVFFSFPLIYLLNQKIISKTRRRILLERVGGGGRGTCVPAGKQPLSFFSLMKLYVPKNLAAKYLPKKMAAKEEPLFVFIF
jgi:hypothetical protein